MRSKSLFCLLLTVLVLAAIGCGDKVAVRGKVTFSDDHSPLTVGQIRFQSGTVQARGTLKSDGTYVLGTVKEKDGVPKGTYNVTIVDAMELVAKETKGGAPAIPVITPLIDPFEKKDVVVDGKQKTFDFEVERIK